MVIMLCAGSIVYKYHVDKIPEVMTLQKSYYGEIIDIPEETEKSVSFTLKLKASQDSSKWNKRNVKIITYMSKDSSSLSLQPGSQILFNSRINKVSNYGNPEEFNYKRYLAVHNIHYQAYISEGNWSKLNKSNSKSLLSLSNALRLNLINQLKNSGLQPEEYAVASALILGYKDLLTKEIRQKFSSSGAVHILAVSGLHVGIIYLLLSHSLFFLSRNKLTRTLKTLLIVLALCFYAYLTGLSPSVSRATLMFSIVAVGKELRRDTSVFNSLAVSAFILLAVNPKLLFSVGFQLSYLAVLSIVFFQPRLYQMVNLPVIPDKLWQWLTVALAAQIGTAPLVIHYFNQFPNYFWLTNFIAIPAAAGVIIFGLLFLFLHPVSVILSSIAGWFLKQVLVSLNFSLEIIKNLPFSLSDNLWLDKIQVLLLYLIVLIFSFFLIKRSPRQIITGLGIIILFLVWDIFQKRERLHIKEFVVFNVPSQSVYNYISPEKNLVFSGNHPKEKEHSANNLNYFTSAYWLSQNAHKPDYYHFSSDNTYRKILGENYLVKNNFMNFSGTIIYLPKDPLPSQLTLNKKINVDYIIISNSTKLSLNKLNEFFTFDKIILDSSMPYYERKRWLKILQDKNIPCYDVSEKGAFRIEINQKNDKKV